jgi:hypothetical protein
MSLELISSKNNYFFQNYPALIKKIKSKKLLELEPKINEIKIVSDIIKNFIIDKKRKIYGGYALHLLLNDKNKSELIYDENDTYDIDFYSPEPIIDLKELCDKIHAAGFKPVLGQEAQHKETYSVYVNYQLYCDITYMPNNIYKKLRFMFINNLLVVHPYFLMIDYFRMFTDPLGSFWRLEKHFERYMLLQKHFPLPIIKDEIRLETYIDKNIYKIISLLFNEIVNYESIVFTGLYTYNYYLHLSEYTNTNNSYNYLKLTYYEVYSTNYVEDGLKLLNYIKSLPQFYTNKIFYVEYNPFFQFYGNSTIFYYNYNGEHIPILYLYENNKRSIPFKKFNLIKFKNNNQNEIINKEINICSFDFNILHSLITLVKLRIDDEDNWNDVIYKYIHNITIFRNHYLKKFNKTIYDDSLFQSFVIECMGEYILPERQRRLLIEIRRKLGKPFIFKYEPQLNRTLGKYLFYNSSGNQINNPKYLKLTEENRNNNILDELEKNELLVETEE